MAQPLIVAMPPGLILKDGYVLELAAVDPTTGADVAGVDVSNVAVQVDLISAGATEGIGPVLLTYASDRSA